MRKKLLLLLLILAPVLLLAACSSSEDDEGENLVVESNWEYEDYEDEEPPYYYYDTSGEDDFSDSVWLEEDGTEYELPIDMQVSMNIVIDTVPLMVQWENNDAVTGLSQMASQGQVSVKMSKFGGFEQVGTLPSRLPRDDVEFSAQPGDIVLYSGNKIVVFYGTHLWSYTPLGRIVGVTESELTELLGGKNITLVITAG